MSERTGCEEKSMRLTVLGCNGPYPAIDGATAGYLVRAQKGAILLDAGSGVFARLSRFVRPETLTAVLLSHLHHDHMADMGVFNYYLEQLAKRGESIGKIPCYLPGEECKGVLSVGQMTKLYPYFEFIPVEEGKEYLLDGVKATFFALKHGAVNYGVRLEEGGRALAYSGDTNVCPGLDRLLDGSHFWLGGAPFLGEEYAPEGGHLSVELMQTLAEKHAVRALVTHLCPLHSTKEYLSACTDGRTQIAEPFHEYEI